MSSPANQVAIQDTAIISAQIENDPAFLLSELKEEAILLFYYGPTSCSPEHFVDLQLDHIILGRLTAEKLSKPDAEKLVLEFLANYQHWACTARFHAKKTFNAVRFNYYFLILKIL